MQHYLLTAPTKAKCFARRSIIKLVVACTNDSSLCASPARLRLIQRRWRQRTLTVSVWLPSALCTGVVGPDLVERAVAGGASIR
jgi:hypothetical protein